MLWPAVILHEVSDLLMKRNHDPLNNRERQIAEAMIEVLAQAIERDRRSHIAIDEPGR